MNTLTHTTRLIAGAAALCVTIVLLVGLHAHALQQRDALVAQGASSTTQPKAGPVVRVAQAR